MAADLATTPTAGLQVQLCGDAHVANFGSFAAPDRKLVFDLNDFDETLPGPWEWDVKRLAASLAVLGRQRGFDASARSRATLSALSAYRRAMHEFAAMRTLDVWYARLEVENELKRWSKDASASQRKRVDKFVEKARAKDSARALAKLTHVVDGEPRIISNPPLVVPLEELVDPNEARGFESLIKRVLASYGDTLSGDRRHLLHQYHAVHMAHKVVGVGSVGNRAWIVLALGRDGGDPLMLQVKEAERSVLEPFAGQSEFEENGQRVVEGQRLMQAASDVFLGWLRVERAPDGTTQDYYVRQLWDQKGSPPIEVMKPRGLRAFAKICGWTLARAHARTGNPGAIAAYLGRGSHFDEAVAQFAEIYADQNERDHAALAAAAKSGRITAAAA